MAKTFTDLTRHALNGATMGTRWSALFHMPEDFDVRPVEHAMTEAVAEVDTQMSTWKADSDLMRLNAAPTGDWVALPAALLGILDAGLAIGRASQGAFDIALGDAVSAWGFGPEAAEESRIRRALQAARAPAHEILELDVAAGRARKHAPARFDLNGIAKGHGVDRLAEVARGFAIPGALLAIDGELRALATQPDGSPWTVAIEDPDPLARRPCAILDLEDAAVATSGDYRHFVEIGGRRLSHTMDPKRGGPLSDAPVAVTVVAETCRAADAWATALMVKGRLEGARIARRLELNALFIDRDGDRLRRTPVGPLFEPRAA